MAALSAFWEIQTKEQFELNFAKYKEMLLVRNWNKFYSAFSPYAFTDIPISEDDEFIYFGGMIIQPDTSIYSPLVTKTKKLQAAICKICRKRNNYFKSANSTYNHKDSDIHSKYVILSFIFNHITEP
jgi:hypothetical protein